MVIISRKLDESGHIMSEPDNVLFVLVVNSLTFLLNKTIKPVFMYQSMTFSQC